MLWEYVNFQSSLGSKGIYTHALFDMNGLRYALGRGSWPYVNNDIT